MGSAGANAKRLTDGCCLQGAPCSGPPHTGSSVPSDSSRACHALKLFSPRAPITRSLPTPAGPRFLSTHNFHANNRSLARTGRYSKIQLLPPQNRSCCPYHHFPNHLPSCTFSNYPLNTAIMVAAVEVKKESVLGMPVSYSPCLFLALTTSPIVNRVER